MTTTQHGDPPRPYDTALQQIEASDLRLYGYRTARRLLDKAKANAGYIAISLEDLMSLSGADERSTWYIMEELGQTELLRFDWSTDRQHIFISFSAWERKAP